MVGEQRDPRLAWDTISGFSHYYNEHHRHNNNKCCPFEGELASIQLSPSLL